VNGNEVRLDCVVDEIADYEKITIKFVIVVIVVVSFVLLFDVARQVQRNF